MQELIKNAHQCLVAEIAYDPDPIAAGASPGGSDKLAQRNLSIVASANPGDLPRIGSPTCSSCGRRRRRSAGAERTPDELLIDWGDVPAGTNATIYIPEVDAAQIVALAGSPAARQRSRRSTARTIRPAALAGSGTSRCLRVRSSGSRDCLTLDLPKP